MADVAAAQTAETEDVQTGVLVEEILTEEEKTRETGIELPTAAAGMNHGKSPDRLFHIPVQLAGVRNPEIIMGATVMTSMQAANATEENTQSSKV